MSVSNILFRNWMERGNDPDANAADEELALIRDVESTGFDAGAMHAQYLASIKAQRERDQRERDATKKHMTPAEMIFPGVKKPAPKKRDKK